MEDVEKIQLEIKMYREGYADGEAAHEDVIVERDSLKAKLAETERDSQRDRADSKQRGWDEANRQLDAMAAKLAEMEQRYRSLDAGAGALKAERDAAMKILEEYKRSNLEIEIRANAAVQRAEAAEQREADGWMDRAVTIREDTEWRVVEEIAVLLASMTNEQGFVSGMHAAAAVRAGAYRKQGARDGE